MTLKPESRNWMVRRGPNLLAIGGLVGALAASSCCILPVALFGLGISGVWIGNFTQLAPTSPILLARRLLVWGRAIGWFTVRNSPLAPRTKLARVRCQIKSSESL